MARRVVHFQPADHSSRAAVLDVHIAGAVHDLQRPKEPNAGTFCRCDRYIFHAGNGQADITGTAYVSHPVRSCRAQLKIVGIASVSGKGHAIQFTRMFCASHRDYYKISNERNFIAGHQGFDAECIQQRLFSAVFLVIDHCRACSSRFCRQCRCAHAQHHAQRHEGREQPLGQGRLLHTEFLLFCLRGGGMRPP